MKKVEESTMELMYMDINKTREIKKEITFDKERVLFIIHGLYLIVNWFLIYIAGFTGIQHFLFGNKKYGLFRLGIYVLSFYWPDPDLIIWLTILNIFDYTLTPLNLIENYRNDVINLRKGA